ncbi:hypothetical protein, conserved [Entamoeba dispar SAW760]|uniref:Uncharacterized protein n=1 Tax=Entamoeba dispar (strain ATCC PRA-260 / SAW760) TaxID=370354 RepID=B0EPH9_ENTDS|nr:uncharacterized protein EDI_291300 [Entamoeba dispar SAW760]EDR23556.1 hypothetical protein, conserved [Entamoeba dispar SAW760]|eukprot:EDR23556.1 hypothetical protein, conserved [Entamoeba dispar SAW760]
MPKRSIKNKKEPEDSLKKEKEEEKEKEKEFLEKQKSYFEDLETFILEEDIDTGDKETEKSINQQEEVGIVSTIENGLEQNEKSTMKNNTTEEKEDDENESLNQEEQTEHYARKRIKENSFLSEPKRSSFVVYGTGFNKIFFTN